MALYSVCVFDFMLRHDILWVFFKFMFVVLVDYTLIRHVTNVEVVTRVCGMVSFGLGETERVDRKKGI